MKRILITGVCGLIGSHLLDNLLHKGYRVVGLDNLKVGRISNIRHNLNNKNFKFIKGDITNITDLKKTAKSINTIVHLAASKKIDEKKDALNLLKTNIDGTRNVFEIAKKNKIKVIFASTSDVYGTSDDIPFKEDGRLVIGSPTAKRWAYAASKICGEHFAFAYHKEFKVPTVILRYFGGFSPRASFSWSGGHLPIFIDAILKDKPVIIHGDGTQTRSMTYVDDMVRGTVLAVEEPKAIGEVFNIGSDYEMSIIKTARLIHKIAKTGKKLKLKFVPHKKIFGTYKEIRRRVPDLSKAKKILGYRPKTTLEEGIKITMKEHKKNLGKHE